VLVTPLPGTDRRDLREDLRSVRDEVCALRDGVRDGLRDGPRSAHDRLLDYFGWVNDTVRRLGRQISAADIDRLLRTKGYDTLLTRLGWNTLSTDQDVLNDLISAELDARCAAFDTAFKTLDDQIQRWAFHAEFVVLDTNIYVRHPQKLQVLDIATLLGNPDVPVHILVPIVIVDELDRLKRSGDSQVRYRAGYTLAVLNRAFQHSTGPERLPAPLPEDDLAGAEPPAAPVTIEIVFDPPEHVRLPINDDEIIDRIRAVQPLTARRVTLLTYDNGPALRARHAGLPVIWLDQPRKALK
jgi:rRNA-processing protein FCF1